MPKKKFATVAVTSEELDSINSKLNKMYSQTENESFNVDSAEEIVKLIVPEKMSKNLKGIIANIANPSREMIKMLVNIYYEQQKSRIVIGNRMKAIERGDSVGNTEILEWLMQTHGIMEIGCKDALEIIVNNSEVGRWLMQVQGIGPVIAAGLLAYFNVKGINYPSAFIEYAGLNDNNHPYIGRVGAEKFMKKLIEKYDNPKTLTDEMVMDYSSMTKCKFANLRESACKDGKWSKEGIVLQASKIPYNKDLKTLMWKIGRSFIMQCNNSKSLYGRRYAERKILETERNEAGEYAEQAKQILESKNFDKSTVAYSEYIKGRLPKKHIEMRAMRYAVKAFVVHVFEEMYRVENDDLPPLYYPLVHVDGHRDVIKPEVPYTMTTKEKELGHYIECPKD